jgi:histidyl-tRNA synthetase
MNLDVMGNEVLSSGLVSLYEKKCPSRDDLMNGYKAVTDLLVEEDYVMFGYGVYGLLGIVWKIVAWEVITAFFALEGVELMSGIGGQVNGGEAKVDKKSEKKKKKKTVLGKGTSVIVQLIKDRLQIVGGGSGDSLDILEKWVENLLSFFSPKQPEFDEFVQKVKEIVERNESRRLPKLPKVINFTSRFGMGNLG